MKIFLLLCTICFYSCYGNNNQTFFLADRHSLSYEVVKNYSESSSPLTLVLFDSNNDVSNNSKNITSYNWIRKLIEEKILNKVYWISTFNLTAFEKNTNKQNLIKNINIKESETELLINNFIEVLSLNELNKINLPKTTIASVDFNFFINYDSPHQITNASFVQKTSLWLKKQKIPLITLALSSPYELDSNIAWNNLITFIENCNKKSRWYFTSGSFSEEAECLEEKKAWEFWKQTPQIFEKYRNSFYKGTNLWINAPTKLKSLLLERNIQPFSIEDETTKEVIKTWKNNSFQLLEQKYTYEVFNSFAQIAVDTLQKSINGKVFPPSYSSFDLSKKGNFGIAIRFRNTEHDRGCLALYCDVRDIKEAIEYCTYQAANDPRYQYIQNDELDELYINITIFSDWTQMNSPYDFTPGVDSLIVDNSKAEFAETGRTLLQAPIAAEHALDRNEFLVRILKKAKLDSSYIDEPSLTFYKSKSIFFTAKVSDYIS